MSKSIAVGIDLGTTNSALAWVDPQGRPSVVALGPGQTILPSVICFDQGRVVVGEEAKEQQGGGAPQVAAFFKRQMGSAGFLFEAHGKEYSPTDLSALVLGELKRRAERTLGQPLGPAVVTVPAYFRNHERQATIAAGRQAGLEVLQVINEPTAAAIAYGLRGTAQEGLLLVYDLGGGTFDVTLLRIGSEEIRVLCSEGNHELGGKDWDDRILEFLASRFEEEHGSDPFENVESMAELLVQAEDAKKKLSTRRSVQVSVVHEGRRGRYSLDRATLERLTRDLMERTTALCRKVLDDQRLHPGAVDGVLLIGGSTRMPMVQDFVQATFGKPPLKGANVDHAVALGAAIVAQERQLEALGGKAHTLTLAGRVRTRDVTNHSLGMIAVNEDRSAYINSRILPKSREIPCVERRPYQHRISGRGSGALEVFVTQGESQRPDEVCYLHKYVVYDVPGRSGDTAVIDIGYHYDRSGTVQVDAVHRKTGQALKVTAEELPDDVPERFLGRPDEVLVPEHLTAYLAFDLSGSMSGTPLEEAKRAAKGFLEQTDLANCSLGIIAFSNTVDTKLKACQDARAIERAIEELRVGETGYGNSGQPFDEVHHLLDGVEGNRFAVTLADGVWSSQSAAERSAKRCHEAGIESIAIGFGGADEAFLRRIASSDEASFFTSLGELVETFSSIAQVLTESGGQGLSLRSGR